ncbi:unnamed protein product [Owenia fusiformis]|uniref:Uncharacterized protein n=1 Tax=Owenia fusiformis TaxID=6347 RepID=A0A8J1Y952_OWEFU|nr:unnamed protein product [Owenia fusiformis]
MVDIMNTSSKTNGLEFTSLYTDTSVKHPKRKRGNIINSAPNKRNRENRKDDKTTGQNIESINKTQSEGQSLGDNNAARERSRVQTLRSAFLELQRALPCVPPDTKLSKLDVLVLATTYISQLMRTLEESQSEDLSCVSQPTTGGHHAKEYLHPVKKWPMRSRLYQGISTTCS